jgi:phosphoenolpyruvate---glycerone phosphotransferase subunit DhaL
MAEMMVDCKQFAEMVLSAGAQIRANQELLSKLDSQGGDGDHGTTMARAMDSIEKALEENSSTSLKELLEGIGWAVMGVDGGATGPLFGTFFMSMAGAAAGKDALDAKGFGEVLAAGLAGVQKRTRAQVGDKTMIDALVPAVEAAQSAAESGGSVEDMLRSAYEAAKTGAENTATLRARFGRAKNIGDKSIGHPDAGATSVSLIFRGFLEGVSSDA